VLCSIKSWPAFCNLLIYSIHDYLGETAWRKGGPNKFQDKTLESDPQPILSTPFFFRCDQIFRHISVSKEKKNYNPPDHFHRGASPPWFSWKGN
jgi:hypothetical protein